MSYYFYMLQYTYLKTWAFKNITMSSLLITKNSNSLVSCIPEDYKNTSSNFLKNPFYFQLICSNQDPYKVHTWYLVVRFLVSFDLGFSFLTHVFSCSMLFILHFFLYLEYCTLLKIFKMLYVEKVKYGIHTVDLLGMTRW